MPRPYFNATTPAGLREIKDQIEEAKRARPALIARLKTARALGDLSENTEYSTAKRDLRHLESRLRYLNKQLTYARVVVPKDDDKAALGKEVTLTFLDDQSSERFLLVSRHQAESGDLETILAIDSPLGRALNGKRVGATVTVPAPGGSYRVRLTAVRLPGD